MRFVRVGQHAFLMCRGRPVCVLTAIEIRDDPFGHTVQSWPRSLRLDGLKDLKADRYTRIAGRTSVRVGPDRSRGTP